MRASQAVPFGAMAILYHPKLFSQHEEVIIYERDEFRRTFSSIRNCIQEIFLKNHQLNQQQNRRRLMGEWIWIMKQVHIINNDLEDFFTETPCQGYMDTYMHNLVESTEEGIMESLIFDDARALTLDLL
ncbi:MAG: hypothetical protein A4E25_02062 [Methanobacterium sp. PtaB.Bin024]|nr:MAG: hypothetical protein A4E25_02062 [Methanobacterium sp. PtaB.Bin024]